MALKLAGEETGIQEKTKLIRYRPCLQDSGDLEAATKTITAALKPVTPDYTVNLTTEAPPDSRLKVKRLGQRLLITIDSFGGTPAATRLCYSVKVNGTERATGEFTSTGDKVKAWTLTEGQFNLGSANTLEVFLWVDQGSAVVSACQLWQAVGTTGVGYDHLAAGTALIMAHNGVIVPQAVLRVVGTGTPNLVVCNKDVDMSDETIIKKVSGNYMRLYFEGVTVVENELAMRVYDSLDTDLAFVHSASFVVRSMQ